MHSKPVYEKDTAIHTQPTSATHSTLQTPHLCQQGHTWHPTFIIGYFCCLHCPALAACVICVSKVRGKPICRQHQHLGSADTYQEVLA